MATQTPNLQLDKPAYSDVADVAVLNGNMDKIDTAVKAVQDSISNATAYANYTSSVEAAEGFTLGTNKVLAKYGRIAQLHMPFINADALVAGESYTLGTIPAQCTPINNVVLSALDIPGAVVVSKSALSIVFRPYNNVEAGKAIYVGGAYITT